MRGWAQQGAGAWCLNQLGLGDKQPLEEPPSALPPSRCELFLLTGQWRRPWPLEPPKGAAGWRCKARQEALRLGRRRDHVPSLCAAWLLHGQEVTTGEADLGAELARA